MAAASLADPRGIEHSRLDRVYVWQLPVRLAHWVIVVCLVVLSFTGVYIHRPFLVAVDSRAWTMGTMRFIHVLTGFVLMCALMWRFYWFFAGNRWSSWRQFIPLKKERRAGISKMLRYYLFLRWTPPEEVGHNALAGATYCVIYGLLVLELLTGLALFDNVLGSGTLHSFIGWLPMLVNLQYLRMIHYGVMFLFGAFLIHHVYSAVLVSREEKNGIMESIFSGYKYLPESDVQVSSAGPKRGTLPR